MFTRLRISIATVVLLVTTITFGQINQPLPNDFSEAEKAIVKDFQFKSLAERTPPPEMPVRAAAEWEEVEYLVVTWEPFYKGILRQIVEVGIIEAKVIIVTQNENSVSNYLTSNGVDLTNITFLDRNWDSIWIRDYAGNTVYTNDVGERALVDWIYNRPRPNDNTIPEAHAELIGSPIYITNTGTNDLVNTGGNYMSDGMGNAFASRLVLEENEAGNPYGVSAKSEEQVDGIMEAYMGIKNYIKMTPLPFDVINHIDMHMKLLDEETILVSRYPEGVADGPQIEENIEYVLSNFNSTFGTPYKIRWIDAPPSTGGSHPDTGGAYRTYSNSLILNKSILVPTYRPEVDEPALDYYRELMPGYNVVGIDVDNNDEPLIFSLGALHCITHTIGVSEPLWIVHQPVTDAAPDATVTIEASMKHISGMAQAKLFWREQGETAYNEVAMTDTGDDIWAATFTTPENQTTIEYYVWGQATSGKELARPLTAPEGYWSMNTESLSTQDFAESNIIGPFPNPTRDVVNFKLKEAFQNVQVTITNILGQQLYSSRLENQAGEISIALNPEWQGTLFVNFSGEFGSFTRKVIKM